MKIELVPFAPRHLDMFVPGFWDKEVMTWEFREWALRQTNCGNTAIIDGKVMGCLFITAPVDGVSEVQMFASDEVREKHRLWLGLSFKRALDRYDVAHNLGIETIRIKVLEGFWKSRQWVERMGFRAVDQKDGLITYERAA